MVILSESIHRVIQVVAGEGNKDSERLRAFRRVRVCQEPPEIVSGLALFILTPLQGAFPVGSVLSGQANALGTLTLKLPIEEDTRDRLSKL